MIFRFVPHASLLAALVASVALEPGAAHAQVRSARGRDTAVPGPTSLSIPTDPRTGRSVATGRVLVRVKPEYSITAPRGGEVGALVSRSGMDVSALSDALDALGASYGSMVDLTPAQTAELRQRAQSRSGRWSRDLSDWIVVQCRGDLLSTATYLQGLDLIDHVEIEARVNQSAPQCPECNSVNNPLCPEPGPTPNAVDAQNAGGTNDGSVEGCSALVLEWLPTCIGTPPCAVPPGVAVWDWGCVTMANFLCTPSSYSPNGGPWRTCGDPSGGPGAAGTGNGTWSTFTSGHLNHAQLQSAGALNGSREPLCCDVVCAVNYLCCTISWDSDCAASALTIPDCFITRDYLADLNAVADPLSPDDVSIYDLNPGTAGFDQGNPYQPTGNDTPYYGDSNLLLGQTFNPGPGAAEFPLAAPATIAQPALSPGLDGVQGQVAIGSMPLALWGTRLRQLPPPNDPSNTDFFPFMRTTTFLGGGLDVGYMDFLSNALFGVPDLDGNDERPENQGGVGQIRVGVVDLSMFVNHEEFLKPDGTSKILVESGQSPFLLPPTPVPCACGGFEASAEDCCTRCGTITTNSADCVDLSNPTYPPDGFVVYPQHGTAVMSVLVANRDTKGVTGLCPDAQPWFFPALTPTGQNRTAAALAGAVFALTAETSSSTDRTFPVGNVCVVPLETAEGFQPLNSVNPDNDGQGQAIRDVISLGTDAGLTWVMSAGNGARIVNPAQVSDPEAPGSADTTSVVVVGGVWPGFQLRLPQDGLFPLDPPVLTPAGPNHLPAVWPGNDYCRVGMSNFLNPEQEAGSDNLTISGWASGVCAAGYGDLFLGNDAKASYTGPALPGQSGNLRRYTANFGGTSAATAMIGGAAVLLQEFSKLNYEGVPIPPVQVRNVLRGQAPGQGTSSSIFPQCGQVTPPTASENPVFGDTNSADTELARVIGFPNLRFMALDVSTGNWFDPEDPNAVRPVWVNGKETQEPQSTMISAVDNIYVKAKSQRARASATGGDVFGPSIPYALPGRVTDIQVTTVPTVASVDEVTKINVQGNTTIFGSGLTLAMVFVYNNETARWELWLPATNQLQVLPGGVATGWVVQSPGCSPASSYVVTSGGAYNVYTRVVTMAGGTGAQYMCWHDQIRIVINGTDGQYTVGGCGALVP